MYAATPSHIRSPATNAATTARPSDIPWLDAPESATPNGLASVVVAAAEGALELEDDDLVEAELLLLAAAVLEARLLDAAEVEADFVEVAAVAADEVDAGTPFIVPNPIFCLS